MADESGFKLKISISNTHSDDDDSDGADGLKHGGRKTKSDETPNEKYFDKEDTLSVSFNTEESKVSEQRVKKYINKAGTFVIGFDPTSQECREKQEQRAKRFGNTEAAQTLTGDAIEKLYLSLGISPESDKEAGGLVRFDAVHVKGVDEMSTARVFEYFNEFPPSAIEWIDDTSCNVVWMDKVMAARAMLKLSKEPDQASADDEHHAPSPPPSDHMNPREESEKATGNQAATRWSRRLSKDMEEDEDDEEEEDMVDDDDDLNLLSDDDVAKLSHSVVTAAENEAQVAMREARRASVADEKDRNIKSSVAAVHDETRVEEAMDVDNDAAAVATSAAGKQSDPENKPEKEPSAPPEPEADGARNRRRTDKWTRDRQSEKMPPGRWRVGVPHPNAKHLYIRYATTADIKLPGAGKRSRYYQKYGNPNFGGMKGLISGSRKRKIFSQQHRGEIEEAKKAVEEAKWKRGIPDETKFDEHVEEIATKRSKRPREPVELVFSDEELNDFSEELVVGVVRPRTLETTRPPEKKRFMKMHADDLEEKRGLTSRLGSRNDFQSRQPNIRDRLGVTTDSLRMNADSRQRGAIEERSGGGGSSRGTRISGDLRSRLGHQ